MNDLNILLRLMGDNVFGTILFSWISPNDVHRLCVVSKHVNVVTAHRRWPITDQRGVVVGHVSFI